MLSDLGLIITQPTGSACPLVEDARVFALKQADSPLGFSRPPFTLGNLGKNGVRWRLIEAAEPLVELQVGPAVTSMGITPVLASPALHIEGTADPAWETIARVSQRVDESRALRHALLDMRLKMRQAGRQIHTTSLHNVRGRL